MAEVNIRKYLSGGDLNKPEDKDPKKKETESTTPVNPVATNTPTAPTVEVKTAATAPTSSAQTTATPTQPTPTPKAEEKKLVLPGGGNKYRIVVNGENLELDDYQLDTYAAKWLASANGAFGKDEDMYNSINEYKDLIRNADASGNPYQFTVGQNGATSILTNQGVSAENRGLNDKGKLARPNMFTGFKGERGKAARFAVLNDFVGDVATQLLNDKRTAAQTEFDKSQAELKKAEEDKKLATSNLLKGKMAYLNGYNFFGTGQGSKSIEALNIRYNKLDDKGRSTADKNFLVNMKNALAAGEYDDNELIKLIESDPNMVGMSGKDRLAYIRGLNLDDPNTDINDVYNKLGYGNFKYELGDKDLYENYQRKMQQAALAHEQVMNPSAGEPVVTDANGNPQIELTPEQLAEQEAAAKLAVNDKTLDWANNPDATYYNVQNLKIDFLGTPMTISQMYDKYYGVDPSTIPDEERVMFENIHKKVQQIVGQGHAMFKSGNGRGFVEWNNLWKDANINQNPYASFGKDNAELKGIQGYSDYTRLFSNFNNPKNKGIKIMMESHEDRNNGSAYRPTMLIRNSQGKVSRVEGRLVKGMGDLYRFEGTGKHSNVKFDLGRWDQTPLSQENYQNYTFDNNYNWGSGPKHLYRTGYDGKLGPVTRKEGGVLKYQEGGAAPVQPSNVNASGWDLNLLGNTDGFAQSAGANTPLRGSLQAGDVFDDDYKLTDGDWAELGMIGADLVGMGLAFAPGAGLAVGAAGAVSSGANAYAKAQRGEDWGMDLAVDLGLDVVTALPFAGGVGKGAKFIRGLQTKGKVVRRLLQAGQVAGVGAGAVAAWDAIGNGDWSMSNIKSVIGGLQGLHSLKRSSKTIENGLAYKSADAIHTAKVKVGGVNKDVKLTANELAGLQGKSATEQADLIKGVFLKSNPNVKLEDIDVDMNTARKLNSIGSWFKKGQGVIGTKATGANVSTEVPKVLNVNPDGFWAPLQRRAANRALINNPELGNGRYNNAFGREYEGSFFGIKSNSKSIAKGDAADVLSAETGKITGNPKLDDFRKTFAVNKSQNDADVKDAVFKQKVLESIESPERRAKVLEFEKKIGRVRETKPKTEAAKTETSEAAPKSTPTKSAKETPKAEEKVKATTAKLKRVATEQSNEAKAQTAKEAIRKQRFTKRDDVKTSTSTSPTTTVTSKVKTKIENATKDLEARKQRPASKAVVRKSANSGSHKARTIAKVNDKPKPRKRISYKKGGVLFAQSGDVISASNVIKKGKGLELKFNTVDFSELLRASANAHNALTMNVKQEVPLMTAPTMVHPTVKGNILSKTPYYNAANRYDLSAKTPINPDASLNLAGRLSAKAKSNEVRLQGDLINAQSIAQQEAALQQSEQIGANMRAEVANQNTARVAAGVQKEREHKNLLRQNAFQSFDNYWRNSNITKYQKEQENQELARQEALIKASNNPVSEEFIKTWGPKYRNMSYSAVNKSLNERYSILANKQYRGEALTDAESAEFRDIQGILADSERDQKLSQINTIKNTGRLYDTSIKIGGGTRVNPAFAAKVQPKKMALIDPLNPSTPSAALPGLSGTLGGAPNRTTIPNPFGPNPFAPALATPPLVSDNFKLPKLPGLDMTKRFAGGGRLSLDDRISLESSKNQNRKSIEWYKNIVSLLRQEQIEDARGIQQAQKHIADLSKMALGG